MDPGGRLVATLGRLARAVARRRRWLLLSLASAGLTGCTGGSVFQCAQADECSLNGVAGTCEPDGYCSFPEDECPSGRRYGELAPAGLAGTCVPVDSGTEDPTTSRGVTSVSSTPPLTGGMEGTDEGSSTSGSSADGRTTGAVSVSATASSGSGPPPPGSTSAAESSTTGPEVEVIEYPASIAACTEAAGLDPDYCAMVAQPFPGAFAVDQEDMMLGPFNGYLRFDLDGAVNPGAVWSVTLRLVTTGAMSAGGPSSGEVWAVEPFELSDLSLLQPATVGPMLAPDQGLTMDVDVVEWPLPPDLFMGDPSSLYFGVLPTNTNGLDYWSVDGMEPPMLIVEQTL